MRRRATTLIDDLTDAELLAHLDALAGAPRVQTLGWRVSEHRLSPRPNADRDAKMTDLHDKRELDYTEIGRLFNLKPRTVARAVQRFRQRRDSESLSPRSLPYDGKWRKTS
jgi:hypothetical protein